MRGFVVGGVVQFVRARARQRALLSVLLAVAFGLATLIAAQPAAAVANRTVGFWSMDEPAGSTVLKDSSGNGRNGTIGADVSLGTVFEGATAHRYATVLPDDQTAYPGHIDRVPHSTDFNPDSGDFSLTVRLRTTYSFGNIVQKGQGGDSGGYWKLQASGGTPSCLFRGSNGQSRTGYSSTDISDGQWHTIRCVRTSSYVEMYVDGVRTSRANGLSGNISNTKILAVGGKAVCDGVTVTCDYFVGDIDYLRLEKGTTTVANQPPVASFTSMCTGLVCSFDASGSTDSDGAIQRHVWTFGDGDSADTVSVPSAAHTYTAAGTYTVSLTVTDDDGAVAVTTREVIVAPSEAVVSFVGQATANANATGHQVAVPTVVRPGDSMFLFFSNNKLATVTPPDGWTAVDTLVGGNAQTQVWRRTAVSGDAGSIVRVSVAVQSKANLAVVAYRGLDPDNPLAAVRKATDIASTATRVTPVAPVDVAGAWGLSYWMHGDGASTQLAPPPGVSVRSNSSQTGSGRVSVLLADSNATVPEGSYGGLTATAAAASTTTTTWTLILQPAGTPPPANQAPTAVLSVPCVDLACFASAAGSSDPDGFIATYTWDFGDGTAPVSEPDAAAEHTYAAAGDYTVTLTVTDDEGATGTATAQVSVDAGDPVSDVISFVGQSTSNAELTSHAVTVPSAVQPGDALLLLFSEGSLVTVPAPTGVTGWTAVDTVDSGSLRTQVWKKVAAAGDAGGTVQLTLPTKAKGNLIVAAYRGTDPVDPVVTFARQAAGGDSAARTTPVVPVAATGTWALSYWAHRDSASTTLTPPAGVAERSNSSQTGGGRVTVLLADSNALVPVGTYGALTATAAAASSYATTWTVLLAPAAAGGQ